MINRNQYQKVVPFIVFILALILLFVLVRPVITILLGSVLLAYICYPLYKRIMKKIRYRSLSIVLSIVIVTLIAAIPVIFLTYEVVEQGYIFYDSLSSNIQEGAIFGYGCTSADSKVCAIMNQVEKISSERLATFGVDKQLQKLVPLIEEKITLFILRIPLIVAEILLTLILCFFILHGRQTIITQISDILPMRTQTKNKLINQFKNITHTVIYAQILVAFVQGVVGAIGFYLFGIPFPIILGLVLAFASLLPTIGTALVWGPAAICLIIGGYYTNNPIIMWKGVGLFLYGLCIISTIDNFLLGKLVK
ncbi:MAG: AI-2E family transporter, partial [Nanoarchaeota archaeon]